MALSDSVHTLLVKAHLADVPRPVLRGTAIIAGIAILATLVQCWILFSPQVVEPSHEQHIAYDSASNSASHMDKGTPSADKTGNVSQDTPTPADGGAALEPSHATEGVATSVIQEKSYVYVHVAGAVMEPGVYGVVQGARVQEAVDKAGGASSEAVLEAVNLARVVQDGEQIYVPTQEEVDAGGAPGVGKTFGVDGAAEASGDKPLHINVNKATVQELEALPGVGPSTAQKIITERETHGAFSTVDDLMRVSGIGEKKFAQLRPYIYV